MTPIPELDPAIHAAARLKVMATLSAMPSGDTLAFPRLQKLLEMTPGNLSTHLRKLEEVGYVEVTKAHRGRTPTTRLALSSKGRAAWHEYRAALVALLTPESPAEDEPFAPPVGAESVVMTAQPRFSLRAPSRSLP